MPNAKSNKPWDKVKRGKHGRPQNDGTRWDASELARLKRLAKRITVAEAAARFNRTIPAVQQQAMRQGVAFR